MLRSDPEKKINTDMRLKKRMDMFEWELQKTLELLTMFNNVSASMRFLQQRVGLEAAT